MKGREREASSSAQERDKREGRGSRGVTKEDLLSLAYGFPINCRVMEPQGLEEENERDWELCTGTECDSKAGTKGLEGDPIPTPTPLL